MLKNGANRSRTSPTVPQSPEVAVNQRFTSIPPGGCMLGPWEAVQNVDSR